MFSVVDGALLKPLPFPNPERIVRMWETPTADRRQLDDRAELRRDQSPAANVRGVLRGSRRQRHRRHQRRTVAAGTAASSRRITSTSSASRRCMGRTFRADEDQPGANHVIVLSHAAWQQRFGADPAILSRDVRLDGDAASRDRRAAARRLRSRSPARPDGRRQLLEAARPDAGAARGRLALAEPGRAIDVPASRSPTRSATCSTARAAIADLIPQWKKDWSVTVEPFDAVLVDDRLRQSLYVALGVGRPGAADRLRQPHQSAAVAGSGASEGDRGPRRARREPRARRVAADDGKPGARRRSAASPASRWPRC